MARAIKQVKFKVFDKYDFVKSFVALSYDGKNKDVDRSAVDLKEKEAAIIADAIEENQNIVLENLATKEDLKLLELSTKENIKALELSIKALELSNKKDLEMSIKALEYRLTIRLTAIMAALLTFLPIATDFVRHIFKL